MRDRRLTTLSALLVALMLTGIAPLTANAAGTRFGAKLTQDHPADASRAVPTARQHPLDASAPGSRWWRTRTAAMRRRPGTAPSARSGSSPASAAASRSRWLGKQSGDRRRSRSSRSQDHQLRQGQPRAECGGENVDDYKIQTFSVNFHVNKGDYIAAKGNKVGFMRNSEQRRSRTCSEPPLPVGGSYQVDRTTTTSGDCSSSSSTRPDPSDLDASRGPAAARCSRTGYHPRAVLGGELAVPCTCNPLQQG